MFEEAADASNAVRAQLTHLMLRTIERFGVRHYGKLNAHERCHHVCARGSSDHAATYAKYMIETHAKRVDCLGRAVSEFGVWRYGRMFAGLFVHRDLSVRSESLTCWQR